jgi:hypothetical protein
MIPASDQYPIFQWLTYYGYYMLLHVTTYYYLLLLSSDDPMGYSSYNYGYPLLISVIWRTPTRTGLEFAFPQSNGDVFAFTEPVNSAFQHCIPRGDRRSRPRISVILWGRLVEGGAGLLRCSAEVRWAMGKLRDSWLVTGDLLPPTSQL